MHTRKPAVAYSLDGQIDLLIHARNHQILRTVSFDNGDTWLEWRKMKNHKSRRTVGFASTADGRTKYMVYQIFDPTVGTPVEVDFHDRHQFVMQMAGHYGFDWNNPSAPMRANRGQFSSGPAVLCSPDGNGVALWASS